MPQADYSILDSWPGLREDLASLLSDTDVWVISELKRAHEAKDWQRVGNLIDVMEMIHNISHHH